MNEKGLKNIILLRKRLRIRHKKVRGGDGRKALKGPGKDIHIPRKKKEKKKKVGRRECTRRKRR